MKLIDVPTAKFIEILAQIANVVIILGDAYDAHMYYGYLNFEAASRSNVGSIEFNQFKGVNITDFVRSNLTHQGGNITTIAASYAQFIERKQAVNVKFSNSLDYLIYAST